MKLTKTQSEVIAFLHGGGECVCPKGDNRYQLGDGRSVNASTIFKLVSAKLVTVCTSAEGGTLATLVTPEVAQ